MTFSQSVPTPAALAIALVCMALGVLLTWVIMARRAAAEDDKATDKLFRMAALCIHETAATLKPLIEPALLSFFLYDLKVAIRKEGVEDPLAWGVMLKTMIAAALYGEENQDNFTAWLEAEDL